MIITKKVIEKLVSEIINFLSNNRITEVSIFYNGLRIDVGVPETALSVEACPLCYFEYVNRHHILSMRFDGSCLCSALNDDTSLNEKFTTLLEKYGLYYELGNVWNLSVYPLDVATLVEYTDYTDI